MRSIVIFLQLLERIMATVVSIIQANKREQRKKEQEKEDAEIRHSSNNEWVNGFGVGMRGGDKPPSTTNMPPKTNSIK